MHLLRVLSLGPLLLGALACATAAPRRPFVQSPAYKQVANSVYGILERDLDADGVPDAVVARKSAGGYAVSLWAGVRGAADDAAGWSQRCTSSAWAGDELMHMAWLGAPGQEALVVVVGEENPEDVRQTVAVLEPRACRTLWQDTLRVDRAEGLEQSGFALLGNQGISLSPDGNTLLLLDHIEFLKLEGAQGPVWLPVRARERQAAVCKGEVVTHEASTGLLTAVPLQVAWMRRNGAETAVPQVQDGRDDTALDLPPGEHGTLSVRATAPVSLLEVHHGCEAGGRADLDLQMADADIYTTGELPQEESFVLAAGRRHGDSAFLQDLLALRQPTERMQLHLAAFDAARCIREVTGYQLRRVQGLTSALCQ